MTTAKQAQRQAKRLFRLCTVNGAIDEARARAVAGRLLGASRPGALPVLTRLHRLLRLDRAKQSIQIQSAAPLPPDVRTHIAMDIRRLYGPGRIPTFTE